MYTYHIYIYIYMCIYIYEYVYTQISNRYITEVSYYYDLFITIPGWFLPRNACLSSAVDACPRANSDPRQVEAKGTLVVLVPAENKHGILQLCWLVVSTPLKNMKVNGKEYPMYDGK